MNEAARSRWDDTRREPVLGTGRDASDPLAELARLVGQDDPYRNMFRPAQAPVAPVPDERGWHDGEASSADRHYGVEDHGASDEPPVEEWHGDAHADAHGYHAADAETWTGYDETHDRHRAYADDERYYAAETASHRDDAGIAESAAAVDGAEASIPDLWAANGDHGDPAYLGGADGADRGRTREGGSARRPLLVLGAVLLLTGGGLGASFLAKSGSGGSVVATNGSGAPTILAASGPTKVKQDDPSATAPEDKDAALLSKGAAPVAGPVKVVQSEEQPADLGQLPKADDSVVAAQAQPPSPFPDAKKVKTFVVHPDGTPIYDDGQAAAPPPTPASVPVRVASAPQASTPKAAGSSATTPPTATIASLVAGAPPATDTAPTPASPAPKTAKPKPVEKATGAGVFGLQLAASPSEAEAHAAFAKLKKKYPAELGSLSANVHQSETGGKPVFRVRVGGMTREEASGLCSKLMAGGGSCFVVHD